MIHRYICFAIFSLLALSANAQVGIHTENPHASAAVDMRTNSNQGGVLLPRMTAAQKLAISNPAHGLLVYDTDNKCVSQNIGTEAIPEWTCLTIYNQQFFYMPSINIPTTTLGAGSINLHAQYQTEFGTPMYRSTGAPASIGSYSANELSYYVTYYDPTLITVNSISNAGVMSYTILKKANKDAYLNIVFVVK